MTAMSRRIYFVIACLVLGALLFNGWVFGLLGHGSAGYFQLSISELEVSTQPWHWLFRSLDGLSGLLLVIGGVGIFMIHKIAGSGWLKLVAILIAALGLLTLVDVAHPLDCVRYQNPACVANIAAHHLSHTNELHESESRITAYASGFLALLAVIWAFRANHSKAFTGLLVVLLALIIVTLQVEDHAGSVVTDAIAQRLWNLLVTSDLILLASGITKLLKEPK